MGRDVCFYCVRCGMQTTYFEATDVLGTYGRSSRAVRPRVSFEVTRWSWDFSFSTSFLTYSCSSRGWNRLLDVKHTSPATLPLAIMAFLHLGWALPIPVTIIRLPNYHSLTSIYWHGCFFFGHARCCGFCHACCSGSSHPSRGGETGGHRKLGGRDRGGHNYILLSYTTQLPTSCSLV